MNKTAVWVAVVAGMTILVCYYTWSIHRRYYIMVAAQNIAYEVDRKTGETWMLHGTKKILQKADRELTRRVEELPKQAAHLVTGNAGLRSGYFSGRLYNGSDWIVTRVIVHVIAKEEDGTVRWSRKFADEILIQPMTTGSLSITVVGDAGIKDVEWSVENIYGYRESSDVGNFE